MTPTPLTLTDVENWLAGLDADAIDDEAVDFAAREVVRRIRDRSRR